MQALRQTFISAARAVLLAGLVMGLVPFTAAAAETRLAVSATVLKHASIQWLSHPDAVVVSAVDIFRGYVDIPAAAQMLIRSNTPAGFLLSFTTRGDFVHHTLVTGLGNELQVGAEGGSASQPIAGTGMSSKVLSLHFRYVLSDGARQGVYPWPMQVEVAPL